MSAWQVNVHTMTCTHISGFCVVFQRLPELGVTGKKVLGVNLFDMDSLPRLIEEATREMDRALLEAHRENC